jgi:hypothetical protein
MKIVNNYLQENNTNKYIIYIDLDGVLTNFNEAFEKLGYGKNEDYINKQSEFFKILAKAGESLWSEMNWMSDGKILWDFLKQFNPTILSAPTTDPDSKSGKIKWIKRELGSNIKYILDKDKFKYATPNSILIDDSLSKLVPWKEHGGIPIFHTSFENTIKQIKKLFKDKL